MGFEGCLKPVICGPAGLFAWDMPWRNALSQSLIHEPLMLYPDIGFKPHFSKIGCGNPWRVLSARLHETCNCRAMRLNARDVEDAHTFWTQGRTTQSDTLARQRLGCCVKASHPPLWSVLGRLQKTQGAALPYRVLPISRHSVLLRGNPAIDAGGSHRV
jgi:hypothetical protein